MHWKTQKKNVQETNRGEKDYKAQRTKKQYLGTKEQY